jgi:hypothetical protein
MADARHHRHHHHRIDASGNDATVIGGRPDGCPHAYCGCGLRKFLGLVGSQWKKLDAAIEWLHTFPRTAAHAGAAAVKSHHVMLLVAHVAGNIWTVRDYNSGHGLSRIHDRNVSGFAFVEVPTRVAMQ